MAENNLKIDSRIEEYFKLVEEYKALPLGKFWQTHQIEILEVLSNEQCKDIYPNAYKILMDKCNIPIMSFDEKIREYLELTETNKKLPLTTDKFSNGMLIGSFLLRNITKIYTFIQTEMYENKYPNAYKLIKEYYEKFLQKQEVLRLDEEDRIKEFLSLVSFEEDIPKKNSDFKFSSGELVGEYWINNRERLYNLILSGKYDYTYPLACQLVKQEYQRYIDKKNLVITSNKIRQEFFQIIDKIERIPTFDENLNLSNGSNIAQYWKQNGWNMYMLALKEEYKRLYPKASKIIITEYNRKKLSFDDKLREYLLIVERDLKMPLQLDRRTFSNGEIIGQFWSVKREEIYKEIESGKYMDDYPNACQLIKNEYILFQERKSKHKKYTARLNKGRKLIEFFRNIEKNQVISPKQTFSNGTSIWDYWFMNRKKLYDIVESGKYNQSFPKACEIIRTSYIQYEKSKNVQISFEQKIEEFLQIIELDGYIPPYNTDKKFSDGSFVKYFINKSSKKEQVYNIIQTGKYDSIYPLAVSLIKEHYKKYVKIIRDYEGAKDEFDAESKFQVVGTKTVQPLDKPKI